VNASGTLSTAALRAFWQAVVQFGGTTLLSYQLIHDWTDASVAGGIAAFLALGFRGAVEGLADRSRQMDGDVKSADVQPGSAGKA
jgi:hypothetical protein